MQKIPSRSLVITLLCAALLVYFVMMLVTIPALSRASGGMEVFDLNPFMFDKAAASSLLGALGTEGREYYLWRQIPLDFLYPGLMGAALSLGMIAVRRSAGWTCKIFSVLPVLPVIAAALDYVENIHVIVLLSAYPELPALVCSSGVIVGITKSAFYVVGITTFVVSLIASGFARINR